MFKFTHDNKMIDISIEGCFEPNLTTKIMLTATMHELTNRNNIKTFLELGCGSGVISVFLLKHGFFDHVEKVGLSDLSEQAVATARRNIHEHLMEENKPTFDFKIGSGMQIWKDFKCDLIVNDISAISEAIVPMNDWFINAPNNAGIDGISNSLQVLEEFASISSNDVKMLMPVISLSNVKKLEQRINKLGLRWEKVINQSWPLPKDMVDTHGNELHSLHSDGHITVINKFGQLIVDTACYSIQKG